MNALSDYYTNAILAQAAYATLNSSMDERAIKKALGKFGGG